MTVENIKTLLVTLVEKGDSVAQGPGKMYKC